MNNVVLIGNLTKDPEVRNTTTGKVMGRFTIAVNDRRKNTQTQEWEDSPSFIPVVVFGKQAQNCEKYLYKGSKCAVRGKIQTGSYEGKNGTVYTTDVIADEVEFLGSPEPKGYSRMNYDEEVEW